MHNRNAQHNLQVLFLPVARKLRHGFGQVLGSGQELARRHGSILRDPGRNHHRAIGVDIADARDNGVVVRNVPVRPRSRQFPIRVLGVLGIADHVGLAGTVLDEGEA